MMNQEMKKNKFPLEILRDSGVADIFSGHDLMKKWSTRFSQKRVCALPISTACCSMALQTPPELWIDSGEFPHDLRTSIEIESNVLVFAGMISPQMIPYLKQVYESMAYPKWVVAIGTCAISGSPFDEPYIVRGLEKLFPVDIVVPGCPPEEESINEGFKLLEQKMKSGKCAARAPQQDVIQ